MVARRREEPEDPNPKIAKALKTHWDPSESATNNLKGLGLVAKPNDPSGSKSMDAGTRTTAGSIAIPSVIELFDVPNSEAPSLRKRFPLNRDEEQYMAKCMAKWGDNYEGMFRDVKDNVMQHTEDKLRKMGARYLLLTPEQRRVPIPDNIRDLLPDEQNE